MTDTAFLWQTLNKDCGDIPKTPVESYSDLKETTNKFSDDIKALGEYFPQLASLLNKKDSTDYNLTLEISLKRYLFYVHVEDVEQTDIPNSKNI